MMDTLSALGSGSRLDAYQRDHLMRHGRCAQFATAAHAPNPVVRYPHHLTHRRQADGSCCAALRADIVDTLSDIRRAWLIEPMH